MTGTIAKLFRWMDGCGEKNFSFMNLMLETDQKDPRQEDLYRVAEVCNLAPNNKVIALGNKVSSALSKLGIHHFKLPHPSGKNRSLNDKEFEKNIILKCEEYLND